MVGDYLQQTIVPQVAARVMASLVWPDEVRISPLQLVQPWVRLATEAPETPLLEGPRSLIFHWTVSEQPPQVAAEGAEGGEAGLDEDLLQYCGPGPARATAAKVPRARVATRAAREREEVSVVMGARRLIFG